MTPVIVTASGPNVVSEVKPEMASDDGAVGLLATPDQRPALAVALDHAAHACELVQRLYLPIQGAVVHRAGLPCANGNGRNGRSLMAERREQEQRELSELVEVIKQLAGSAAGELREVNSRLSTMETDQAVMHSEVQRMRQDMEGVARQSSVAGLTEGHRALDAKVEALTAELRGSSTAPALASRMFLLEKEVQDIQADRKDRKDRTWQFWLAVITSVLALIVSGILAALKWSKP